MDGALKALERNSLLKNELFPEDFDRLSAVERRNLADILTKAARSLPEFHRARIELEKMAIHLDPIPTPPKHGRRED